jgi:putative ABC transport system substrate-binding protein
MKLRFVTILLVWLMAGSTDRVCAENIAVVLSSEANAYQEVLDGFREVIHHRIVSVQTLKKGDVGTQAEIKKLRAAVEPDLVFAIGSSALQAVSEIKNMPVVYSMVFNPASIVPPGSNTLGINMNPSTTQVISLLKELRPKMRRVGVIHDASRSDQTISQARVAAEKEGMRLVAKAIDKSSEIGGALKSLEGEIDVLWLFPDEVLLTDEILQRVFLFSFERKIPVLGFSERHTQMGALVSLSYNSAKDMGRQAAETANKMLADGKIAMAASYAALRQIKLTVNLKTARKLDVDVPDNIIKRADNAIKAPVYKEGDWWLFRTKTIYSNGESEIGEHRVTFTKGTFVSDEPHFVRGEDIPGHPSFLPFATVYLTDPQRKWLEFPILPGKIWEFWYHRHYYSDRAWRGRRGTNSTWAHAKAEAVGYAGQPIVTPAGKFDAIEVKRVDSLVPQAYLTYFYSPQSKSVVRLRAYIDPGDSRSSGRQFELELIAYGTEVTGKSDSR